LKSLVLNNINQPLDYQEVANLQSNKKEVVVNVKAAALNHRDLWINKGQYGGIKFPTILGSDGAGEYEGRAVIINPSLNWGKNQRTQGKDFTILGLPVDGTFAEQVLVPKNNLVDKPLHLSFEQAAALPLAGLTAYRALFTKCQLKKGEKVLITGVGGGVALMALQLAVAAGAEVFVTSGHADKIEKAVKLGAKSGVNYKTEDWDKQLKKEAGGFDVIIDSAAGDGFAQLLGVCNAAGRVAFFGGTNGKINNISPQLVFWKQMSIFGTSMGSDREFALMVKFVEKHHLIPVVDEVFSLEKGNDALRRMEDGAQFGKLVLKVG
jgi:zinc-binding alcohol dehydrogenase/oxidoreductase